MALKVSQERIDELEQMYPGIREIIERFENADLPDCSHCGSSDTADVQVGLVGVTLNTAFATTKITLLANGPKPGNYRCNACKEYFDVP